MDELFKEVAFKYGISPKVLEKTYNMQFKYLMEIARTIDPFDENTWNKIVYLQCLGKFVPDRRVMSNVTNRYKRNGKKRKLSENCIEHNQRLEELHSKE